MEDFKQIIVKKGSPRVVVINNPTSYKFIGNGLQGAVFKLSSDRCVKIYPVEEHAAREQEVLKIAKGSEFFPKLYESGRNYTVMEFIPGVSLIEYLEKEKKLTKDIVKQLLLILKEMKQLGIPRGDAMLQHIIINEDKRMKVIDHVNSKVKKSRVPRLMIKGFKELGLLEDFLKNVKALDEATFHKWKKSKTIRRYIEREKIEAF